MALKDISFSVDEGHSLAIIGRTGSGKSTIVNLLLRMFDPDKGSITIDGVNLKDFDRNHFLSQTGCVPQEVLLFSDTIEQNIAFGMSSIPSQEVIEKAARDAVIFENIAALPKGFQTLVGERGITLSGGQKQRVSIARALIRDPRLLILDDCLSAVDTLTEEKILNNLERLMINRTSVLVSHRVSTVKNANHILVIDNGTIIEQGNHASLIEQGGAYASFHRLQQLEEAEN